MTTKVIGLGNPLFGDDSFGLHVIEEIKSRNLKFNDIELISLPTPSPWDIYEVLREGEFFVIVDVLEGGEAGKIEQFSLDEVCSVKNSFKTVHDLNINQVLDLLRVNGKKIQGVVVAIRGYNFNLSLNLSKEMKPFVTKTADKVIEIMKKISIQQLS